MPARDCFPMEQSGDKHKHWSPTAIIKSLKIKNKLYEEHLRKIAYKVV